MILVGQVRRTRLADEDILAIWLHIARADASAADRVLDKLDARFHLLLKHPGLGLVRSDVRPGLRQTVVDNYLVFYHPDDRGILVVRVLHARRKILPEAFQD